MVAGCRSPVAGVNLIGHQNYKAALSGLVTGNWQLFARRQRI
jgi:hypothetical protein